MKHHSGSLNVPYCLYLQLQTCTYETADDVCCGRGARGEKPAEDREAGDEPIRRFRDGGRVGGVGRGGRRGGRRRERDERDGK